MELENFIEQKKEINRLKAMCVGKQIKNTKLFKAMVKYNLLTMVDKYWEAYKDYRIATFKSEYFEFRDKSYQVVKDGDYYSLYILQPSPKGYQKYIKLCIKQLMNTHAELYIAIKKRHYGDYAIIKHAYRATLCYYFPLVRVAGVLQLAKTTVKVSEKMLQDAMYGLPIKDKESLIKWYTWFRNTIEAMPEYNEMKRAKLLNKWCYDENN